MWTAYYKLSKLCVCIVKNTAQRAVCNVYTTLK